jgi:hypothetical protein
MNMRAVGSGASIAAVGANTTPSMLFAARPSAATYTGALIRFTDVGGGTTGTGGGNFYFSNGTRWKPVNGSVLLDSIDTPNAGTASTTPQQLNTTHVAVPAGVIAGFDRMRVWISAQKSGTVDTATITLLWGPLGTTADPVIATLSIATTNTTLGTILEFKRLSATSLQWVSNGTANNSYGGATTSAYPAATTVSNMDSTVMYLSIVQTMSTGVEFATINDYTLEQIASDS